MVAEPWKVLVVPLGTVFENDETRLLLPLAIFLGGRRFRGGFVRTTRAALNLPGKPVVAAEIPAVGRCLHERIDSAIEFERQMAVNWVGDGRDDGTDLWLMEVFC